MELGIKEIVKFAVAGLVLIATVGIIVVLFKGKGGDALASIGRLLRFG